jgi:hypothetical protein
MRWLRLMLALSLTIPGGNAAAGAWPREAGKTFLATHVRLSWPRDIATWTDPSPTRTYRTLYVEHGVTDALTLGLDIGHAVTGNDKTVVFLQLPLVRTETKMTAQLGFGRIAEERIVRPGLSIGRGRERGWMTADVFAELSLESGRRAYKADLTWGRNLSRDRKLILQMQLGMTGTDPAFARFAPSYVFPVTDRVKFELGAMVGLRNDEAVGVKLGFWSSF